jgi:DNA-binding NarL/FixJ family response regulator
VREHLGTKPERAGLTPRQLAVLQRLLKGLPNKLIARELGLADRAGLRLPA